MNWAAIGALLLALAVLLGAFGAHALRARFDAHAMDIYEKAVFYQFVHALGLVAVGIASAAGVAGGAAGLAAWLLCAGIAIFSGSLYALAVSRIKVLGAITPLGGVAFVAGWCVFAYALAVR